MSEPELAASIAPEEGVCTSCGEFFGSIDCCMVLLVADALVGRWGEKWTLDNAPEGLRENIMGDACVAVRTLREAWKVTS